MNSTTHKITLDLHTMGSQVFIPVLRGDTNRKIAITLTDGGRPFTITEECRAYFSAIKEDGNYIYNDAEISIEDNCIIYKLTAQTSACAGIVVCQVKLVNKDGEIISTPTFSLTVKNTIYNEQPIVASSEEFNVLSRYVIDLENKLANGEFKGEKGDKGDTGEVSREELNEALKPYAKLSEENLDGIKPYGIPMGSPYGDGSFKDSGMTIDQFLTPYSLDTNLSDTSTNAPQTQAVAMAIRSLVENKADKENWRLINEVTLTENAVVSFNKDKYGNSFSLKKFEIIVQHPAVTSATNMWVGINGVIMAQTSGSSASATKPTYRLVGELSESHRWDIKSVISNSGGRALATMWAYPMGHRYDKTPPATANEITISKAATLTSALSEGAIIKLMGVDA